MKQETSTLKESKDRREKAGNILRNHIAGSAGVALIPMPLVDLVALTGIQLNMLRRLAKTYEIAFFKDTVKHLLASLIGGSVSVTLSRLLASAAKSIPVIGQSAGAMTMPVVAGATTYAVGKVFIQHFESGGTFLDFDPDKVKAYYTKLLKEGEQIVGELKDDLTASSDQEKVSDQSMDENDTRTDVTPSDMVGSSESDADKIPDDDLTSDRDVQQTYQDELQEKQPDSDFSANEDDVAPFEASEDMNKKGSTSKKTSKSKKAGK